MNAQTLAPLGTAAPRLDARFIEEHRLIEQYLDRKLPAKAARELENWCRTNPGYLDELRLGERAAGSLQLLEACGRPVDLTEPPPAWWSRPYVSAASGALALLCLLAFWALFARFTLLRQELADTRTRQERGALTQPATQQDLVVAPDRTAGTGRARIVVSRNAPQLIDLHLDMGYSRYSLFRLVVDKRDQGRALIVNELTKDSNGELRLTFNTSGLAAGEYAARIEGLPARGGGASPEGWVTLDVN